MEFAKPPMTVWGRVGYVLYWAGIVVGLAFGALVAIAASPLGIAWEIVFAIGAFLVPYTVGWGACNILGGR
jgi:hypothetical protein